MIKNLIANKNLLLILSVLGGIFLPQLSGYLAPFTFWFLAIVMTFSLSGLSFRSLFPINIVIKPMLIGVFLNYLVFGVALLAVAALFFDVNSDIFIGFVIIAATPPGVAIIPFTFKLKGDLNYSIVGVFGAFLASVFLTPLIIELFVGQAGVDSMQLLKIMMLLIVLPFGISRLLRQKQFLKTVEKTRGQVIDIGFALIIYASVGINNHVFFNDFSLLLKINMVFLIVMFIGGFLIKLLLNKKMIEEKVISTRLLFAIKSSGFAVVTAMELFGEKVAVPATVMSVLVLVYLLVMVFEQSLEKK